MKLRPRFFLAPGLAVFSLSFSLGLGLIPVLSSSSVALGAEAAAMSAADIAGKLNADRQDGTSYVRLRMEINGGGALQLQTKERRSAGGSDVVYQILFPKERKGESVLLRKGAGKAATGAVFLPPDTVKNLDAGQMKSGLFGSDLAYEDVIENFFAWSQQSVAGTEAVGRVSCTILESKPGKSDRSSYASVKSWIDTKRMVPLRVEKYNSAGAVLVRIETTNVEKDDLDRHLPASLTITRAGSSGSTVLEGSRIKHGVTLTEADFSTEGLKTLTTPK